MKCLKCGHKEVKETHGVHKYIESGLNNVTLVGVNISECPNCGEREVGIPKILQLHGLIAEILASKTSKLNSSEIRFLRTYLGFSSADFAKELKVTTTTVSRWENDKSPMDQGYELALRSMILKGYKPKLNYKNDERLLKLEPQSSGWKLAG